MEDRWLLLRGLAREHIHWLDFPEKLSAATGGSIVTCADLPGTGSEHLREAPRTIAENADDIIARVLGDQGVRDVRWWIFGISLGGMVAMEMASRVQLPISGVAVANTSSALCAPLERMKVGAALRLLTAAALPSMRQRERLVLSITSNASKNVRESSVDIFANAFRKRSISRRTLRNQILAAAEFQLPRKLSAPLLVLSSRADRLVSPRCSERIADYYHAPHVEHLRAGHDLALDDAEWVCDQLQHWQVRVIAKKCP